jgi:hypothetical protein
MSYLTPLLADADMFKLILLVVVGLIYLVNYLVGGNGAKAQQRRPMKPEPRPAPRPRPRSVSPRFAAQGPGSSSSDDVSELLRRAAGKRGQPARSAVPPPIEPEPTRRLVASLDDTSFGSLHSPENSPPTGSGVSGYVQQQLGNRAFDERHLSHLEQSESDFAAHTQQMFQHTVGHLAAQTSAAADADAAPSPTTPPANPVAETVGALLADPRSLRQAVILNEILDRPVARW